MARRRTGDFPLGFVAVALLLAVPNQLTHVPVFLWLARVLILVISLAIWIWIARRHKRKFPFLVVVVLLLVLPNLATHVPVVQWLILDPPPDRRERGQLRT